MVNILKHQLEHLPNLHGQSMDNKCHILQTMPRSPEDRFAKSPKKNKKIFITKAYSWLAQTFH